MDTEERLQNLSLEELADLAIVKFVDGPLVFPSRLLERAIAVVDTEEEVNEITTYWQEIFGDVTSEEALEMVDEFRRSQALSMLQVHDFEYGTQMIRKANVYGA